MEKKLVLDYYTEEDYNIGCIEYESLSNEKENIYFSVSNLSECPEDAIIGRDLFTADDYIATLKKGMELAQKGYTDIIMNEVKEEDE